MTIYTAAATRTYTVAPVPTWEGSFLRLFLPNGAPNPEGIPLVIMNELATWVDSVVPTTIDPATTGSQASLHLRAHTFLEAHYAVIICSTVVGRGSTTGNPEGSGPFNPAADQYGTLYRGNGCVVSPESPMPPGLVFGIHPFVDPTWLMTTKHYCMALQHVIETLGAEFNLDLDRVGGGGQSAGGMGPLFALWGEDHAAAMFPGGTGQNAHNTRSLLKCGFGHVTQTFFPVMQQTGALWFLSQVPGTGTGYRINAPGGLPAGTTVLPLDTGTGTMIKGDKLVIGGIPDRPRVLVTLSGGFVTIDTPLTASVADNATVTILKDWAYPAHPSSLADQSNMFNASPLVWAGKPSVLTENRTAKRCFLSYGQLGTAGAPYDETHLTHDETNIHGVWHGVAAKQLLQQGVHLVVTDDGASTGFEDEIIRGGEQALWDRLVEKFNEWLDFTYLDLPIEPVEERVLREVEAVLRTITAANDYLTDVQLVQRWEDMGEAVRVMPAILVEAIGAEYDDAVVYPYAEGAVHITLALFLQGWQDRTTRVSRFIADVRRALQAKFDADGFAQLAVNFHIKSSTRETGLLDKVPVCGATLHVQVDYRNQLADTYAQ